MYQSFQEIIDIEKETGKSFWEIVRDNDCREMEITPEDAFQRMQAMYQAMGEADASYDPELTSASGLVGGDGEKLAAARATGAELVLVERPPDEGEGLEEILQQIKERLT